MACILPTNCWTIMSRLSSHTTRDKHGPCCQLLPLMWLPMVLGFLIETFGTLIRVPDVVHRLSPWEYTPRLLTGEMDWVPVIVQLAVAVVLVAAGVVGFRRRDIED